MINNAFWNKGEKVYKQLHIIKDKPETLIFNNFRNTWAQYMKAEKEQRKIVEFLEMGKHRLNKTFVLDPIFIQDAFVSFETIAKRKTRRPVSTGFIGMYTLLRSCRSVSAFGFCNSVRDRQFSSQWHDLRHEHLVYNYWYKGRKNGTGGFKLTLYPPPKR